MERSRLEGGRAILDLRRGEALAPRPGKDEAIGRMLPAGPPLRQGIGALSAVRGADV